MSTQTPPPPTPPIQNATPNNHNVAADIQTYSNQLAPIHSGVASAATNMAAHDKDLFEALGLTLDFGLAIISKRKVDSDDDWEFLKAFLDFHKVKWTSKSDENIFHGIVDVAFGYIYPKSGKAFVSSPTLSKYRLVLRFALDNKQTGSDLTADLHSRTFRAIYDEAVKFYSGDPFDTYLEDNNERYKRAVTKLGPQTGPILGAFPTGFKQPDKSKKFVSAIVQVNAGQYKVISFEEETDDEIKEKVTKLVPAEAIRARKKLTDKYMYWLYVLSDFYTRFLPNIAEQITWDEQLKAAGRPVLDPDATDEEIQQHLKNIVDQKEEEQDEYNDKVDQITNGTAKIQKFVSLNALSITGTNNVLTASSLTTHPNTPCVDASGIQFDDGNWQGAPYTMTDTQVTQFKNKYLKFDQVHSLETNGVLTLYTDNQNIDPMIIEDHSTLANWRRLDPSLVSNGDIDLGRRSMLDLNRWKEDFSGQKSFGRKAFKSIHLLEIANGELSLTFSDNPNEKRLLGVFKNSNIPSTNSARYFDYKNMLKLLDFAKDYGVTYEIEWLQGHQGASALKFHAIGLPFNASVTLPMMLSMKGNPVEIAV